MDGLFLESDITFLNNEAYLSTFQTTFFGTKRLGRLCLNVNRLLMLSTKQGKLLGVNSDNALKFEAHYAGNSIKKFMRLGDYDRFR